MKMKRYLLLARAVAIPSGAPGSAQAESGNEYLDMDITQLMTITVTSVAKKEQHLLDAAAAVFVITQEDIRRSGVTTLPDALNLAPGVHAARINSNKWSVSTRGYAGYTSNKLLVLIDGRSVYSPAYSGVFWDMQNTLLEDIDRIEVVRGPGGTLWGANAVNGVINIITKKAQDTQGGLVRLGGGNQFFTTAARYGAKVGENNYGRAYLTYDNFRNNSIYGTTRSAEDEWRPFQTGFRFDGEEGERLEWTLQGDVYRNEGEQLTSFLWAPDPPYFNSGSLDASRNEGANILGRVRKEMGDGQALTFKAYYDYANRDEHFYQLDFETLDLDLQYETPLGDRHDLTMGLGYRSVWGEFSKNFQVALSDRQDNLYSAFVQDEITLLSDRLHLTLGTKFEHNDYTGVEWQPSARLHWKPHQRHALWLSAARAVRTPAMVERSGKVLIGMYPSPDGRMSPMYMTGNDDFESEELYAYEAGYRWQVTERLFLDTTVFYNDYDKVQSLSPVVTPTGVSANFSNVAEGESKGFEVAADWKATDQLSFALAYSYLDFDIFLNKEALLTGQSDTRKDSSPMHQLSLRSSYSLLPNVQLNLWGRYLDSITNFYFTEAGASQLTIDEAILLDANIVWTLRKGLELMLVGQNLLDSKQLHFVSEYATPPTEIERSIFGKITWRF